MDLFSELAARGFVEQLSDASLKDVLNKKKINFYIGFDPTADSLHLGNLVGIIVMMHFAKAGHRPFALVGGATGRIGDPSGKSIERPFLDSEILNKNIKAIETFLCGILSRTGMQPTVVNNDTWLGKIGCIDFLREIGKHFRLGSMLSKECVKLRLNSPDGMSFTEFCYQILQAYDFYHLHRSCDVILQVGGSDQWGNITAGIELVRKMEQKTVYGFTFPLLTRSDGKKFGKSEGGAIWLSPEKLPPYDFYQYLIGIPDADVVKMLKIFTFLDLKEIEEIERTMTRPDYEPNSAQRILAKEVTRLVHGEAGLREAIETTEKLKPGAKLDIASVNIEALAKTVPNVALKFDEVLGRKFTEVINKIGLVSSKSEAVRLIQNGGAYLNEERVEDPSLVIEKKNCINGAFILVSSGKKKKILISLS